MATNIWSLCNGDASKQQRLIRKNDGRQAEGVIESVLNNFFLIYYSLYLLINKFKPLLNEKNYNANGAGAFSNFSDRYSFN